MFGLKDILRMPEDGADSLGGSSGISDDLALLEGEDSGTPIVEDESVVTEEEHEEGEQPIVEEEEQPEGDKPREDLPPHERPTYTDIKNYDAKLFEKFPGLKDVMFREKAYTELFSSIEDAKESQENSQAFVNFRQDVMTGDGSITLKSLKDSDPKALQNFASHFLPTLFKIDEQAHWAAANPILESMVKGFYNVGKTDEEKKSAELFAKFVFGKDADDVLKGVKTYIPKVEEKKLDPERLQFMRERYTIFHNDTTSTGKSGILKLIHSVDKNGKSKFDPDGVFTPFMAKTLAEMIYEDVDKQLVADKEHMRYMSGLWKKAEEAKFTNEWKTRIIDAYLARARHLVPATRARIVSEALGTTRNKSGKTREIADRTRRPEGGGGGAPSRGGNGFRADKKIDYTKTSDDDIINDNITYKQ